MSLFFSALYILNIAPAFAGTVPTGTLVAIQADTCKFSDSDKRAARLTFAETKTGCGQTQFCVDDVTCKAQIKLDQDAGMFSKNQVITSSSVDFRMACPSKSGACPTNSQEIAECIANDKLSTIWTSSFNAELSGKSEMKKNTTEGN